MQIRRVAIALLLMLGSASAALGQTLTFDLLNNTDDKLISMRIVVGELLDFTPMASGETKVFHVKTENGVCNVLVRARFSRGAQVGTSAYLCEPRGLAFTDWGGSHFAIVFRDQLGL